MHRGPSLWHKEVMTPTLPPLACIVLAAGQGTRMKSALPKVLHKVAGLPMIAHVLNACGDLAPAHRLVVIGPDSGLIEHAVAPVPCVIQPKPLGTGDAVKAARKALEGFQGDIAVVYSDSPLITSASIQALQKRRHETGATIIVAGFEPKDPSPYGRLVRDAQGHLLEIVESFEATPEQAAISLCWGGMMLFDSTKLWALLDQLTDQNSKKEFFLTDCIALARQAGGFCATATVPAEDVLGVNNRVELAQAEAIMQRRLREKAMRAGVTMQDPESVFLSMDTKFGRDVVLAPHIVIGAGVDIADNVEIRAFCSLEQTRIEEGAIIGPFARLRPGASIGAGAHIGNFVEIKNSTIGKETRVNHLSYIGDADLGSKSNIGAGTILANYDIQKRKHRSQIGSNVGTGANSVFVAPVSVGDGAYIGAGSVITHDVPADALAVARSRQSIHEGWAARKKKS